MEHTVHYGFQAHLTPQFPSQIIFDVTEVCNMACIHCPHPEFQRSGIFRGRHLDVELHHKMIDEVASEGKGYCRYLRYTAQGEPLLHPRIVEMVRYAAYRAGVPLNLTTNGTFLRGDKAAGLIEAGVDVIDVSIDASTSETYARVRKKGNFEIVKENVLELIKLIRQVRGKTKVVVSFVEQPLNQYETVEFEKFWKGMGVDAVVIRRLHSAGGFKKDFVQPMIKRYPCLYPWERLTLGPDGFIHFCPQDWVRGSVICDYRDTSIAMVWQSDFMQKLRQAHLENNFTDHPFCGNCPDWSATRWPGQGDSYANLMHELVTRGHSL